MKKLFALLALFIASAVILAGCNGSNSDANKDKKVLHIELPLKTTSIAPYETDIPVQVGAAESLFKMTSDGKLEKLLVEDYDQPSPERLEITLKDNITFQNGEKLTGNKVKKSLENSLQESDLVKGSLPIKEITADGQKVTITTAYEYPELISELASPFAAIYDVDDESDVNKTPVGTGPYQIKEYKRTQKITLDKNKDYWQGEPKLDGITVTYQEDGNTRVSNLKSGKADLITDVPVDKVQDIENSDKTKVSKTSGFRTSLLLYNHTSDKMSEPVREALDKIIDRESIAKEISNGYATPATGPFNDKLAFIEDRPAQKQDIEAAKKLLEKEGYTKDHPLQLQIATYDGRPELPKIAQVIQSDAKKANIDIDIRNVDDIEGYLKNKDQWDATMYSFGTIPRGDTGYFFNQAYKAKGAINKGGYDNKQVTALIDQLNTTVGQDNRAKLAQDIMDESEKDIPNSYITYNDQIVGLNKDVTNFEVTPEGIYLIDYKVDIE
jgi:peptide/nickel transport system substrate-binding protein